MVRIAIDIVYKVSGIISVLGCLGEKESSVKVRIVSERFSDR